MTVTTQRLPWILLLVAGLAALPRPAHSYFACGVDGAPVVALGGSPFIGFTPSAPDASQPVAIAAGMVNYAPLGAVATAEGTAINVAFNASYLGFATPPALSCSTATVGPLVSGHYTVNMFLVDAAHPIPALVATSALAVGPAATAIPTISPMALLFLASFVAILAYAPISRHTRRDRVA